MARITDERVVTILSNIENWNGKNPLAPKHTVALLKDLLADRSDAQLQICLLSKALKDCADDLEAEIEERYRDSKAHPPTRIKYRRDMDVVLTARNLLKEIEQ